MLGDLLLKMENLDKRLLAAILYSDGDNKEHDTINEDKPSTPSRPFPWYNYLQNERPTESSALNELKQKLQTGNPYQVETVKNQAGEGQ